MGFDNGTCFAEQGASQPLKVQHKQCFSLMKKFPVQFHINQWLVAVAVGKMWTEDSKTYHFSQWVVSIQTCSCYWKKTPQNNCKRRQPYQVNIWSTSNLWQSLLPLPKWRCNCPAMFYFKFFTTFNVPGFCRLTHSSATAQFLPSSLTWEGSELC